MAEDNHLLGSFSINDVQKAPKGEMKFDLTFDINADGIMIVTGRDK